jgi:tetratricopeptide (TPR) repeat protein
LADVVWLRRQIAELRPGDPALARAVPLLRKALELDPTIGDAHALLGSVLMEGEFDFEGAERELRSAESISPNGEYVLRYLAQFYMAVGWPPERALEYARRAQTLDPFNHWTALQLAAAYWHAGDYEASLRECDRIIELDPEFWLAHWGRAWALDDLGRYDEALASARRAVELNDYSDTESTLAIAYARVGQLEKARAIFDMLNNPGRGKYWSSTFRALLLMSLHDRSGALAALEQAYEEHDYQLPAAMHFKSLLPLHDEPRFQRLVRLLGQERRVEYASRLRNVTESWAILHARGQA